MVTMTIQHIHFQEIIGKGMNDPLGHMFIPCLKKEESISSINEYTEKEIKKKNSFMTTSKRINYLGIDQGEKMLGY